MYSPLGMRELKRPSGATATTSLAGFDPARLRARGLTRREVEVLRWIAEGKRDSEIATILGISPRTVNKHVEHLFAKLEVETRTAAAITACPR